MDNNIYYRFKTNDKNYNNKKSKIEKPENENKKKLIIIIKKKLYNNNKKSNNLKEFKLKDEDIRSIIVSKSKNTLKNYNYKFLKTIYKNKSRRNKYIYYVCYNRKNCEVKDKIDINKKICI